MSAAWEKRPAWAKRPDETHYAYAAFQAYLLLDPLDRNCDNAYKATRNKNNPKRKTNKSNRAPRNWHDWLHQHDWIERAAKWDLARLEGFRQVEQDEIKRAQKRRVQGAQLMQAWALKIYEKAKVDLMETPEARKRLREANDAWRIGVQTERLETGEPTDIVDQRQKIDADVSVAPSGKAIDEMLEERIEKLKNGQELLMKPEKKNDS